MSKNQAPWKRKYGRTLIAKLLHTLLLIGVFEFQYVAFGEDGVEESLAGLILVGDNVKTATASEFTLSTVRFMDGGNLVSRVGCQALYSKGEFRDVTVMNSHLT